MANTYELPDNENREVIEKLGPNVELQTFKTNGGPDCRENTTPEVKLGKLGEDVSLKLVCVGDFSGNWSKRIYIEDYMQFSPPATKDYLPVIGVDFSLKILRRKCDLDNRENQIRVYIWNISGCDRFLKTPFHYKNADGAIVFWGARSSSFESALEWRRTIKENAGYGVPVVLLVDNVTKSGSPASWIGDGMVMDSREAMDEFCLKHGFIAWFEMLTRDWTSGENSVFGQAVSRLVDEVMRQA